MRKIVTVSIASALLVQTVPSTAAPLRLAPSSPWNVDYAKDSCRLIRKFGVGGREVTLVLEQFEPMEWFALTAAGEPLERMNGVEPMLQLGIRFGPNEEMAELPSFAARMGGKPAVVVQSPLRLAPLTPAEKAARERALKSGGDFEIAPVSEERAQRVGWLELSKALRKDLVLETGRMDQALSVLRTCTWDLVGSWGLDIEQQKHRSRPPIPKTSPGTWFRPNEYPGSMLNSGNQAIVNFRVMVDQTGKVTSCIIQTSTRPKEFDDLVCRSVMKRAAFDPALDAGAKPISSFWRQQVTYRIE